MTRKECLEQAMGCVLRDRNSAYGKPEDCFATIADFWSVWLGHRVTAHDVGMCLALLKVARAKANPGHADNYTDLAGYAACSAEIMDRGLRAEGCEDLVFDEARMRESMPGIVPQDGPSDFDAPQTKEALFRHIVDCNPSIYKPRTPTGEELADMAEEDAHE